jgi:hypothetical protein
MRIRFAQQIHPQDIGSFDLIEFDTQHPRLVRSEGGRGVPSARGRGLKNIE